MLKDDSEKRLVRLREAKLEAERERDECRQQSKALRDEFRLCSVRLKSISGRLRLARQAIYGKASKIRKNAFLIATKSIRLKNRIKELESRIDELTSDRDRLQKTIDTLKTAEGLHKCGTCGHKRPFDCFPLEPRFVIGRDLKRCRVCTSNRVIKINAKKYHGADE